MKKTWIVGLALCFACGDDSDGRSSGVSATKKAGDLTVKELQAICRAVYPNEAAGGTAAQWCTYGAASEADTKAECIEIRDECIADEKLDPEDDGPGCDELTEEDLPLPACQTTVGEIEKCLRDDLAASRSIASKASCDTLAASVEEYEDPASCAKVSDACFGDEDEDIAVGAASEKKLRSKSRLGSRRVAP